MELTQEGLAEWKTHPVTIKIFQEIASYIEELKDVLADGLTLNDVNTGQQTAKVVGQIEGLKQIIEFTVIEEEKDDNQ